MITLAFLIVSTFHVCDACGAPTLTQPNAAGYIVCLECQDTDLGCELTEEN